MGQGKSNSESLAGLSTPVLHLDKFAPGATDAPEPTRAEAEEGTTMFIRKAAVETVERSPVPVVVPRESGGRSPKERSGLVRTKNFAGATLPNSTGTRCR